MEKAQGLPGVRQVCIDSACVPCHSDPFLIRTDKLPKRGPRQLVHAIVVALLCIQAARWYFACRLKRHEFVGKAIC